MLWTGLIVLAAIIVHLFWRDYLDEQQRKNAKLLAHVFQNQVKLVLLQQKKKDIISAAAARLQFIIHIETKNFHAAHLLEGLEKTIPAAVSLNQVKREGDVFTVEGTAATDSDLVIFMGNMAKSADFMQPVVTEIHTENDRARFFRMNLITKLPRLSTTESEWLTKLIRPSGLSKLLREIIRTGKAEHLEFDFFVPGEEVRSSSYAKIPVRIVVKGNYAQTARFIEQVARLPWAVATGDFTITKNDPDDRLTTELMLDVYTAK